MNAFPQLEADIAAELERRGFPTKPRFREPCNNCGLCCSIEPCEVGALAFGKTTGPCEALVNRGGKLLCGFVLIEATTNKRDLARGLGIGTGCSMADPGTTAFEIHRFDEEAREMVKA